MLLQVLKILKRLISNPFEIAVSIMNVDSKLTFHILNSFFFLVSYWLVFTFLVSYWLAFTFFLMNMDSRKYTDISYHEGARRSPMCVHDVVGKSVVNYPPS
jgi:hypothetical protein